jgi:hypothetical protein
MEDVHLSRDLLNKMVMNFLIVEGYKEGALKFEKESGLKGKCCHFNSQDDCFSFQKSHSQYNLHFMRTCNDLPYKAIGN